MSAYWIETADNQDSDAFYIDGHDSAMYALVDAVRIPTMKYEHNELIKAHAFHCIAVDNNKKV